MSYYLVIDIGVTNIKAVIFDQKGRQKGVSSSTTPSIELSPDFREINMEKMWEIVC